jgi:YebC/PmpR family DNA-binding regulatory protein
MLPHCMAGHSHWKQIKEHKGTADKKRSALFSKLLRAVSVAAKEEPNPDFNPRLRTAIETSRAAGVPNENLERAIQRASSEDKDLEEIFCEAYGPGGVALLIKAIAENRNRTIGEIKLILKDHSGKWADPGSVRWAFEEKEGKIVPKFFQEISNDEKEKISSLIHALEEGEDVQNVYVNTNIN